VLRGVVAVANSPDEEDTGRDLEGGGGEGGARKAYDDVDDLKDSEGLSPFRVFSVDGEKALGADLRREEEGASEDPGPEKGRDEVEADEAGKVSIAGELKAEIRTIGFQAREKVDARPL
jgi:hypothetical protein